jgi:putative drug exporter of the RND superfamily
MWPGGRVPDDGVMSSTTLTRPPRQPRSPRSARRAEMATSAHPSRLGRLAARSFDHPKKAIGTWCAVLVALFVAAGVAGASFGTSASAPGSDSEAGIAALDAHFPELGAGGQSGTVVFRTDQGIDDPQVVAAMERLFATIDAGFPDVDGLPRAPGATVVSPYAATSAGQVARSGPHAGTVAFAQVNLAADVDDTESGRIGQLIAEEAPRIEGLDVLVGGQRLAMIDPPKSELIGLAFAVVVLIAAFGSVLAMGLPIAVALGGVGIGMASIAVLSNVVTVPSETTVLALMIGLGVGIDYALFIVSRYRGAVHDGASPRDAVVIALSTAGRAVVFAGATVVISMLGLVLVGLDWLSGMAVGVSVTVLATMVTSLTLLPALLAVTHGRLEVTRWRGLAAAGGVAVALLGVGIGVPVLGAAGIVLALVVLAASPFVGALRRIVPARRARPVEHTWSYRWSRAVQRRPAAWLGLSMAVMLVLASPVLAIRLAWPDEGSFPEDSTTRQAYDLLAEGFGVGFNGPFLLTAVAPPAGDGSEVAEVRAALVAAPGVASVSDPIPAADGTSGAHLFTLVPTSGPQDPATTDLVRSLRDDVIPAAVAGTGLEVHVTGSAAANIDVTDYLGGRMPLFFAAVLGMSFLALLVVFRSVLVPLKAVAMNVVSIGAAYGVVVAVLQWGWGASALGIDAGPINPFIPLMLFAIVFGLSMDYEVFLLSRIREEYERTGDARASVADGLASTARVITAAAAIMVVVFGSFVFEEVREVKVFGLGLAVAVLVDATLVRMVVVPAAMELLGHRNWWMPRWLDRVLPRVAIDGPVGSTRRDRDGRESSDPSPRG